MTTWAPFCACRDPPVTKYVRREDCGKPYLLELHNVRMQEVAMVHDLPCNILHVTQHARRFKDKTQILSET